MLENTKTFVLMVFLLLAVGLAAYSLVRVHTLESRLKEVAQGTVNVANQAKLNEQNLRTFVDYTVQVLEENNLTPAEAQAPLGN